jgi:hypothetical protein
MSFTIPDTGTWSYWIVLSDQTGKVLDWKSMQSNVAATFAYPASDSVNVTMITNTGLGYRLNTYVNVASGDYVQQNNAPAIQNTTGQHTVIISNSNSYEQIGVDSQCWNGGGGNGTYSVNLCGSSPSLFVWLDNGTSYPRYLFKPQINSKDTTIIDSNSYNSLPMMNNKLISFNGSESTTVFIEGNVSNGQHMLVSHATSTSFDPTGTYLYIPYPDFNQVKTLFESFTINLTNSTTSDPYTLLGYTSTTTDPSNFTRQEVLANLNGVLTLTSSSVSYRLSGKALSSIATLSSIQSNTTTSWNIYSKFSTNNNIALPQFPDQIKQQVDFSFLNNMSAGSLKIFESADYVDYQSLYNANLLNLYLPDKMNIISKTYSVRPDGTISGQ